MSYKKDTDYQSKINEAVASGDYESAAKYEQSRNEKIDAEGLNYQKTNRYAGWLDKNDYSKILNKQMASGASRGDVSETLKKRISKASGTEGLSQYAYDDVYDRAIKYIMESAYSGEGKPQYKSSYDDEISKLYRKLSGIKKFSYNPYEDDLYEFYRQQYIREGNRAMEDILGEIAASTGGVASSYAVSAASQAQEEYNKKLTDIIPKLYNDAYERYLDDISRQERELDILSDLSDKDYERYLDSLNQYNKDRTFEYERLMDERETDYKEDQDAIDIALRKWESLGYLDEESAKVLGLPAGLHTTDYDYKKAQQYKLYSK
ncbi:MAG: hypothetical protein E7406_05575 [Ruminococcaceae bacterium]|nr:hypothetical protein [Oscillospiraceae bacterium]